jgi:hypothetical protein
MKTYSIALLIAALAVVGGCSTAYQSGQTPDAVYYSPDPGVGPAAPNDNQTIAAQADSDDDGQYVTYDDGTQSAGYADDQDGYYARRINMFDNPGSLYAFNNYSLGLGYSPYMGLGYSSLGWNPFMWSYPSLSLGWTLGSPWGGWYRPMYAYGAYSPYSLGFMNGYYAGHGYYGYGGYGYGYGYGYGEGKYINRNPRPSISYGPRRSVSSQAGAVSRPTTSTDGSVNSPRRVFRSGNTGGTTGGDSHPRRVFKSNPSEHPVNVNPSTRTVEKQSRVRIFNRSTVTDRNESSNSDRNYRPTETRRSVQPQRRFQNNTRMQSAPSYNSNSGSSQSAPARSFSPRGR